MKSLKLVNCGSLNTRGSNGVREGDLIVEVIRLYFRGNIAQVSMALKAMGKSWKLFYTTAVE